MITEYAKLDKVAFQKSFRGMPDYFIGEFDRAAKFFILQQRKGWSEVEAYERVCNSYGWVMGEILGNAVIRRRKQS